MIACFVVRGTTRKLGPKVLDFGASGGEVSAKKIGPLAFPIGRSLLDTTATA
jgi:hypothetical protein